MLNATEVRPTHRRRRSRYSDKQHYQEYILQRIEGYKNSIGRDELLRLGDEAASELQATSEGQFVLTEVLMLESVDRLIMKRLSLRPYRRWRQQFIKLRAAQRMPTHWGLEPHCPLAPLLARIESEDTALVVGTEAAPTTYLLAAHDAAVTFIARDLGCVERVESRMAAEALASLFESYVTQLDQALPEFLSFLSGCGHRSARSGRAARSVRRGSGRAGARPPGAKPAGGNPCAAAHLQGDVAGRASLDVSRMGSGGRPETPAANGGEPPSGRLDPVQAHVSSRHGVTVEIPSPSDTRNRSHLRNTLSKHYLRLGRQRHERCFFGGEQSFPRV